VSVTARTLGERAFELCRIASPIGQEAAIADHVQRWAWPIFAPNERVRVGHSFVLGVLDDPRPMVALVGHLDTVPAHPQAPKAELTDEKLVALGATDMKGALAVMMELTENLVHNQLPVNLLLVLYEREEGPWKESGLGPLFEQVPALKKVKLGIAMEPTDNGVQVGCVGSLHAAAKFHGRAAHSARPWQGKNAIHLAGSLLSDLANRERKAVVEGGHTFYEVLSATLANGGRARNVVPETFELNLNYRFAPGKTLAQAQADVTDFVGGRAELEFTDLAPSGRVVSGNPFYEKLLKLTGVPAEAKQAWTDVARFSEAGIDAVNFGPGEPARAHQVDESVTLAALLKSYQVLERFLLGSEG
jgi:succinyl-diaminopimelate desuccinylase